MLPDENDVAATDHLGLGVFDRRDSLKLTPAGNGGWVVSVSNGRPLEGDQIIGAFTNTADMLLGLQKSLMPYAHEAA